MCPFQRHALGPKGRSTAVQKNPVIALLLLLASFGCCSQSKAPYKSWPRVEDGFFSQSFYFDFAFVQDYRVLNTLYLSMQA